MSSAKLEHLHRTGSFKERGACNALTLLPIEQRQRGVIAASAGNHAAALAWHGRRLGVPVTVVMPRHAPLAKQVKCRRLGACVITHGNSFAEARAEADIIARNQQLKYVDGFDDPDVIAGQGTIALEVVEDVPDLDAIIVPVGGGGLLAGVAVAMKGVRSGVRVLGVEPAVAPAFLAATRANEPVTIECKPTLADGLAVGSVGQLETATPIAWRSAFQDKMGTFFGLQDHGDEIVVETSRHLYLVVRKKV